MPVKFGEFFNFTRCPVRSWMYNTLPIPRCLFVYMRTIHSYSLFWKFNVKRVRFDYLQTSSTDKLECITCGARNLQSTANGFVCPDCTPNTTIEGMRCKIFMLLLKVFFRSHRYSLRIMWWVVMHQVIYQYIISVQRELDGRVSIVNGERAERCLQCSNGTTPNSDRTRWVLTGKDLFAGLHKYDYPIPLRFHSIWQLSVLSKPSATNIVWLISVAWGAHGSPIHLTPTRVHAMALGCSKVVTASTLTTCRSVCVRLIEWSWAWVPRM